MEFSHVDVSPTMRFDAITIDIEVDPLTIADHRTNDNATTRYNIMDPESQCGPWPVRCLVRTPNHHVEANDGAYDPPAQVQVYGACVNAFGTEELYFKSTTTNPPVDCDRQSNTSLMVMSVGKRFVAEALIQNMSANSSGPYADPKFIDLKTMRRIYSFTIARLSWELSDLTTAYHAECAEDAGACHGLRFPLAPASTNQMQQQELVVSSDALPMKFVRPVMQEFMPDYLPLVQLHEPSQSLGGKSSDLSALAADALLPHNIANISWDVNQPFGTAEDCRAPIENRIQLIFNNHMYIEHGLQTAYTAATFFLLQNGVVKDVIALNATSNSLNFQQSKQTIKLLASIPDQNAWLTLGGCVVLVVGLWSVIAWAWVTSKTATGDCLGGLGPVTTPHVIARVMLDSVHFSPLFLHRRMIDVPIGTEGLGETGTENITPVPSKTVEGFMIDGLTLQPPSESKLV